MTDVYVSSTYEDLKELRSKVVEAIRKLPDYRPVNMENYGADDRAPLDKCLEDARRCEVYLGILGSRAGYVPPGYDKSITRLEYEAARACKRPCLFFLRKEQYSDNRNEADLQRIREFRELAQTRHTCKMVADEGAIGEDVMASLFAQAMRGQAVGQPPAPTRAPLFLPYTCDRRLQQQDLRLALRGTRGRNAAAAPGAPPSVPLCIVHGVPEQAPDKFVEWLGEGLLKEILLGEELSELKLRWPLNTKSDTDFCRLLSLHLAEAAQLPDDPGPEQLLVHLGRRYNKFFVSSQLALDYWQKAEKSRILALQDFFANAEHTDNPPKAILVWVVYKTPQGGWWTFRRDRAVSVNESLRGVLGELETARPGATTVITELGNVTEEDALLWARGPDVVRLCGESRIDESVREVFRRSGRDSLEMNLLAGELGRLLHESGKGGPA